MVVLIGLALGGPVAESAEQFAYGDLVGARETLEPVVSAGWSSGRAKFNLGDVHYRRQDLPRAIAHWRAAGLMMPRSFAVQHNLALARSELARVPTPVGPPAWWMNALTPGELALFGVVLGMVCTGGLFVRRRRGGSRMPWVFVGLVGAVCVLSALWTLGSIRHGAIAVVVDHPAILRDAPALQANQRQSLPVGTEVLVESAEAGFLYVRTGEDELGWLADGAVLRVPR